MPLPELLNTKRRNKIDYVELLNKPEVIVKTTKASEVSDVNVFIPVKGRSQHLRACVAYLKRAIEHQAGMRINIYILENDDNPKQMDFAMREYLNYVFLPAVSPEIEKSLLFNMGFKVATTAEWNIFHDVDIIVPEYFFERLRSYFDKKPNWIQPFTGKRIAMVNIPLTKNIMNNYTRPINLEQKLRTEPQSFQYMLPGAPGGSIVVRNDIFRKIGGYDPELFRGYAPEDAFFWMKLESLVNDIPSIRNISGSAKQIHHGGAVYADMPPITVFHLDHEPCHTSQNANLATKYLINFGRLNSDEKKIFLKLCNMQLDANEKDERLTISLFDTAFAHLATKDGHYSVVHEKKSKKIKYVSDTNASVLYDVALFTEKMMFDPIVDTIKCKHKIGWLIETREVAGNRYDKVDSVLDKFDFVMTHSQQLLEKYPEKTKFMPFGGSWVREENIKIHDKSKDISMIYSGKNQFSGHRVRHEIASQCPASVDLYGKGSSRPIKHKEEALIDYRYSIAIENSNALNYFTEKLLDCFLTGTIPIYWGCPNLFEFFNMDGVIRISSPEELKTILPKLNAELYNSKIDAIMENFERAKIYEINEDLMYEIITKEGMI